MARIVLPGGQWADLVDIDEFTAGRRKALLKAVQTSEDAFDTNDSIVARLVTAWSFELPLPTPEDFSSLDELPFRAADELTKASIDIVKQLTPDFEPSPDPASPTSPSAA